MPMMPSRIVENVGLLPQLGRIYPLGWRTNIVVIKGAGEMATGVAHRLKHSGFSRIVMLDTGHPLAVRRTVSFCEAVYNGRVIVEGVEAVLTRGLGEIGTAWHFGQVAVAIDPQWTLIEQLQPQVVIDAILAKKNLGTTMTEASLVLGLGPGFTAGHDVHLVIETMRGHDLGRVIRLGSAQANTGIPGEVLGHTVDRVVRAPAAGIFTASRKITDHVRAGDCLGSVTGQAVVAKIDGVLRGLIREGTSVRPGLKIGDIDPRGEAAKCFTVSDKARAIGGGVLEAILGASSLEAREPSPLTVALS